MSKKSKWERGGLEVTADVSEPESATEVVEAQPVEHLPFEFVEAADVDDLPPITVSADVSRDPNATVAATLICIGRLYEDSGVISKALGKHIPVVAAEPELHSFLQRMQISIGDFRHSVEQIERSMSERLSEAIQQAVA